MTQDESLPAAAESAVRLKAILEAAVDAIITTDEIGTIQSFNPAAERMFGYSARDVIGRNVSILMSEEHAPRHQHYMRAHDQPGTPRVVGRTREINAMRRDGELFPIELALSTSDIGGRPIVTGIVRDISDRRAAEIELEKYRKHLEQLVAERTASLEATNRRLEKAQDELRQLNARLARMALVDELTGIGNRRAFDERLEFEWRRAMRQDKPIAIILCDIDHFKRYNDRYGHPAGDDCLRQVAAAFAECCQRATEFPARYGGEEFAGILSGADRHAARERAETVRNKVSALALEHGALGPDRIVTVSVGVASCVPATGANHGMLVQAADSALYSAKENGRDRVEVADLTNSDLATSVSAPA